MRSVEIACARQPVKNARRWSTASKTRSSDFRPFARYSLKRRAARSSKRVWSASGTYTPWRTAAFHCSNFLFAAARDAVPADPELHRPRPADLEQASLLVSVLFPEEGARATLSHGRPPRGLAAPAENTSSRDPMNRNPRVKGSALSRAIGLRSGLFVPMLRDGVIMVARAEPGPFSD